MHSRIPLSVPQLLARAREIAGVDIEDTAAVEPLNVLVDSFNRDAGLHERGAITVQSRLLRSLANRLRMQRDMANHPEIRDQRVHAPLVVAGYLRTGSTKLSRMLAASGDFNHLPMWMAFNPASYSGQPGEDTRPRIQDAEQFVIDLHAGSPGAAAVHEQAANLMEEESYIFLQDLRCGAYHSYANVPSYLAWLAGQDLAGTYEYLLDTLKYLQWQGVAGPKRRWVLKSPFHFGQERLLAKVFPDATLLFTHRPPDQFLASMCSLMASYMKWHTDNTSVDGKAIVAGFAFSMMRHFEFRKEPALPYLDLDYREVSDDAERVAHKVYRKIGSPLSEGARIRMQQWEMANPKNKHGGHHYAAADFGISSELINAQCEQYNRLYHSLFDVSPEEG